MFPKPSLASPPHGKRRLGAVASTLLLTRVLESVRSPNELANTFGCSKRTARRLMSLSLNKTPRLARAYAWSASRALGLPLSFLCGEGASQHKFVVGWDLTQDTSEARRSAGDLAMQVSSCVAYGHNVLTDYTVKHGMDGRPVEVVINAHAAGGAAFRMKFWDPTDSDRIILEYMGPHGAPAHSVVSTEKSINTVLTHIQHECKKNNKTKERG